MLKSTGRVLGPPIRITQLLQLTHLGIPLEHITWTRVTMTSDQWICIRHSGHISKKYLKGGTAITVLNPQNSLPQTWQGMASCAKMNPQKPLIAVRAGFTFQVYDLESRKCLHRCNMGYAIHFWTWVNSSIIAIITDSAVYHWNLQKDNIPPVRIFFCSSRMKNAQLIQYTSDANMKWFALTGLLAEDNHVIGTTQVYSVDRSLCQNIEAHCVCFTSYQFKGNSHPSCILVAASRGTEMQGKLHVVELGPHLSGNLAYTAHSEALEFSDMWCHYDFPSSIQVSSELGIVYVITKYGLLHLYDLETCAALCSLNICPDIVFATAFNKETQGIIAISRNGQVLSVDLKREQLVKFVWEVSKRPHVADRLSRVLNIEEK